MDERQLHKEFMSILGETHPGLTFEEFRDSCIFLLFYEYCCLRFEEELEDNYKLKEMVRLAVRGKLQMPSFLRFMESASDFIYLASGHFKLADFSFFRKLKENQSQEKQKSLARFIRKLIKKIDAWDSDDLLYLYFPDYFEELILAFSGMKKETAISEGIRQLAQMFFDRSKTSADRIIIPEYGYGAFVRPMGAKEAHTEVYGYDDNPVFREISSILCYMKNIPFSMTRICTKEEFDRIDGLGASSDRVMIYMPEGVNDGQLMCSYEAIPYDRELISSRTKGELPFLLSALTFLKKGGQALAVLPSAVLYREGKETQIRKYLIDDLGCLDAVILLPDQLFSSAGQKEVLLSLRLNRDEESVMFFDCTETGRLDEEEREKIAEGLKDREDIPGFCACATPEQIKENGYNLNLPRYITKSVREIKFDIQAQKERIAQIDRELLEIDEKIRMYRRDLDLI